MDWHGGGASPDHPARSLLVVVAEDLQLNISPLDKLGGMPIVERALLAARRAGHERILVWAPVSGAAITRVVERHRALRRLVHVASDLTSWQALLDRFAGVRHVMVVGPGTVVSPALLARERSPVSIDGELAEVPAGDEWPASGVFHGSIDDLRDPISLTDWLRARLRAALPGPSGEIVSAEQAQLAIRIPDRDLLTVAELTLRRSIYKPFDPALGRLNRRLSIPLSIALMPTPVTANMMSIIVVALGLYSAWLFSHGTYGVMLAAAAVSALASVLDGCDGEIARLKYQDSSLGCWLDTIGDYSYYVAIFVGMTIGAVKYTEQELFGWIGGIALVGMLLAFALLIVLRRDITGGQPDRLRPILLSRVGSSEAPWTRLLSAISVSAHRSSMPYGILALALAGFIPLVIVLGAIGSHVYWLALTVRLKHLLETARFEAPPA